MIIHDVEQRSESWHALRLGKLTGTGAADMLATIKSGEAAARRDLRMRLVCERLTGVSQEDAFVNAAMQRGVECEPLALAAYEALTGEMVQPVGFISHDTLPAGCSPDGRVGERGLLEIKCPKTATMIGYLRGGKVPTTYLAQITHNLWVSGAEWVDFFSWDDRLPPSLQTFYVRVSRESVDLAAYERSALQFLGECDAELEALDALAKGRK